MLLVPILFMVCYLVDARAHCTLAQFNPHFSDHFFVFTIYIRHIEVQTSPGQSFIFSVRHFRGIPAGSIGFSLLQRKWAVLSLNQDIDVRPFHFDSNQHTLVTVVLEADFLQKKK
jgi:hypothetical protein